MERIAKNQLIELEIMGYTSEGAGISRSQDFVFFVTGALAGELCLARVLSVKKTYAYAKAVEILRPSPERVEPDCPHFPKCGGCATRHMSYEEELDFKRQKVADALSRIGGLDIEVEPTRPSPLVNESRNKGVFPVAPAHGGGPATGFFRPHSHDIVEMECCPAQSPIALTAVREVLDWMRQHRVPAYSESSGRGLVRRVFTRVSSNGRGLSLCLVLSKNELPAKKELISRLTAALPGLCGIFININSSPGNTVLGGETHLLWGSSFLEDELCSLKFRISPLSFWQVNPMQAEKLYDCACELANADGEIALDLFCGVGAIALRMARTARISVGIEVVPSAVKDAEENARLNGIENARFICADASGARSELERLGLTPGVVTVDPPRKGLSEEVCSFLLDIAPKRIVYVSCDPATLARDLKRLAEGGYRADRAIPFDMFPRTHHVETVVLLSKE